MNEKQFQCVYCEKEFVSETRYLKHTCEKMQRHQDVKTPMGQSAYSLYQTWFRLKKKNVPDISVFLKSKYYKPFLSFAEFVKRLKITESELFIRMMNDMGILPSHWARDDMYSYYIEYLDRKISPKKQATITLKTLEKITESADCDIVDVFEAITANELIQLVRERKLSPWLLLKSAKFNVKFELMSHEEQGIFLKLVRVDYWKTKFLSQPDVNQYMKDLVSHIGL